jgi:hypothetical protein
VPDPGKLHALVRPVLAHLERQPEPGAALTREPPRRARRASGRLGRKPPPPEGALTREPPTPEETLPDDAR